MQLQQWQEVKVQGYGHPSAKGTFEIELEKGEKSLFEIIVDTLQRANKKYNVIIPCI